MKCECIPKNRSNWQIIDYRCHYSAFNGYRYTPSSYSCINCLSCKSVWRTKAKYVDGLKRR